MAGFLKKIWKPRIVEYPGRRRLDDTSQPEIYDVSRAEGKIIQEGDGFTVVNMNNLEDRIAQAFASSDAMLSDAFSAEKTYAAGEYAIHNNTLYRFKSAKPVGAWDASKAVSVTVADEISALNENFTDNFIRTYEVEKVYEDTVLQEYNIKKAGYYLIVSAVRIFNVTSGTFPTVVYAYDIGSGNMSMDPVASVSYTSEYSWAVLTSIEKITSTKRNKLFKVSNVHANNFDVRTSLYWLGKS